MLGTLIAMAAATPSPQPPAAPIEITAPGPAGPLHGTLLLPAPRAPIVLILPGSGPTDRDGNNPLGVRAAPYRRIAEGLAAAGIGSVRIDKRGMFASRGAVPDPNAVTIDDYVHDTNAWIDAIRARTGAPCLWLLGHSEGGLIALAGTGRTPHLCGMILASAPGRPLAEVLKAQLHAALPDPALVAAADRTLDALAAGKRVDDVPPALAGLFAPAVQGFLISMLALDPATLAGAVRVPLLILHGDRDLQVGTADARRLAQGAPAATLVLLPDANHVLKSVPADDRAANLATYADPDLPLAAGVIEAIVRFVKAPR